LFDNYKSVTGQNDLNFEVFLNTDIDVYRGGGDALSDEAFTSFSMYKDIASKFGKVQSFKIKPIDTLGSYSTTAETEIIVPKQKYDKIIRGNQI